MGSDVDTSELDRLNKVTDQYNAVMEFLEEFLPGERITLYQHQTGLTDQRVCVGSQSKFLDYCRWREDGEDCSHCDNTGFYTIEVEDRDLPYIGNKQDLVYQYLGIDPKKVEQQRRAILANL